MERGLEDTMPRSIGVGLKNNHVFRLRAFLALDFGEADALAFGQGFEALTLDGAKMHEKVRAIFALDETESLGLVEPFNGSVLL
jgi:hypothetical protein